MEYEVCRAVAEQQQRQIADWLFSTDNDAQGQPRGIGLSLWRFNLGAGSEEQGDSSHIQQATRTECFLNADGSYDWSKQQGQRNFLKLAKERGVDHFLAFMNSVRSSSHRTDSLPTRDVEERST